jgi:hypothetical protein
MFRRLTAVALLCLACTVGAFAQVQTTTLTGTVYDDSVTARAGIHLYVMRTVKDQALIANVPQTVAVSGPGGAISLTVVRGSTVFLYSPEMPFYNKYGRAGVPITVQDVSSDTLESLTLLTSVMAIQGDTVVGGPNGRPVRVAGNTSTTPKYYRQVGSFGIAGPPTWGQPQITEMADVLITSPSNGQVLKFNSSLGKWTNQADATGGGGGGSLTVQEVDGSPSVGSVSTLEFNQALGLVVTDQTGGVARVGLSGVPFSALAALTANRALASNGSGQIAVTSVTDTELGYLSGVSSAIQTQINGKAATSHTHAESDITNLVSDLAAKVPTSRTITAGTGLSGGGDLSANRTLSLDINGLTDEPSIASGDYVAIYDVSAGALRKMTRANFVAGLSGGGGITSLNSQTGSTQTFSKTNDTNVTLTITSTGDDHNFALGWSGALAKGRQHANTVYNDQANTFGAFVQTFQGGANFILQDPTDTSKTAKFDLSNIGASTQRTVNIPNANSTTVQASTASSNQFATSISAQGVVGYSQPSFSNLSGTATTGQLPASVVYNTVTLTAGGGLTGGGDLSANRTFDVGAGTGITVNANDIAIDQSFTPTWTGLHTHNPSTTPGNAILLDIAAIGSAGTRDSHTVIFRGRSDDGSGHLAEWKLFNDVTSNAGASTFTIQSRIDAASFANRLTLTDGGALSVTSVSGDGSALTSLNASNLGSGTVPSARGGAGTVNGLMKANGSGVVSAASAGTDFVAPGAATGSGLTMATARLLGRTTASSGAIEEISVGSGLSLSGGSLSASGSSAPFDDQATALVKGSADATKLLRFEVDGFTTGTTRVLTPQNSSYTIAGTDISQTFSANQTINSATPLTLTQSASSSGSPNGFVFTGGAHTTLAADTEASDLNFNLARTVQFTSGGATFSTQRAVRFQAPTYAFNSSDTISEAATVAIEAEPQAGTNATLSNSVGLQITSATTTINGRQALNLNNTNGSSTSVALLVRQNSTQYADITFDGRMALGFGNGNNSYRLQLKDGLGGLVRWTDQSAHAGTWTGGTNSAIVTDNTGTTMGLGVNGSEQLRISGSGTISLGATTSPSAQVQVFSQSASRIGLRVDTASSPSAAIADFTNNGTSKHTLNSDGSVLYGPVTFSNLGTPGNGTFVYCSDCTIAATCAGSGTGAFAKRLNGAWVCN